MKNFFAEFKKFITRGNVIDMAVGVIVGSSFTAIVNGLSNFILKPITNWLLALVLKKDALSELYTVLQPAYTTDEAGAEIIDLANSIYIDWGAFINSIINFLLIALVLFTIVKLFNKVRESQEALADRIDEGKPTKEERREMKNRGIKFSDKAAVAEFYAEKAKRSRRRRLPPRKRQDLTDLQIPRRRTFSRRYATFLKRIDIKNHAEVKISVIFSV